MKKKKEVLRVCMGCGERRPKREMIRIVRTVDGSFLIDETGKIVMMTRLYNEEEFASLCRKIDELLEK